ncbi:hypothetical protein GZH47_20215 [Paenibacillus rhizovicinus]|uniref:Uncharacterized protein n=1 Tax=Paenibacillus rhizovicinus TaxID=2704463 RepID=A0A6C0P3R1_9BACL|nr:hypothetical protein [Paenibacillus rhizovicinus]QHW32906.1 hypothetical protein GZH47_20215 [Paenibacillus rhizovicinus]
MQRLFIVIAIVLLTLTACGQAEENNSQDKAREEANKAVMEKMAHPKPSYRDDLFEMKLHLDRTTYKKGEPIVASATFAYVGDEPKVTIYGSHGFLGFGIHDGKDFAMDGMSTAERAPTELVRGKTYTYPFFKSGGYGSDDPDADFWRAFYAEKDLILPPGTYVLTASVNFDLHEDIADRSEYRGEVYQTITVEN